MWMYEKKPGVHKFSKNLGFTSKLLGARWVTRRTIHTGHPQILGASQQNLGVQETWRPGIVYPCVKEFQSTRGVQMSQKSNEWWHAPLAIFYPRHKRTAVLTFTMAFLDNGAICNVTLIGKGGPSVVLKKHTQHYIRTRRFGDYCFLPQVNSLLYIFFFWRSCDRASW
jgi:hypothetical protein